MRITFIVGALIAGCLIGPAGPARGEPPAAADDVRRLMDDGQYAKAIQRISAALQLKGPSAKLVNRHEMYLLKGVCHLATRATGLASEAFAQAAKEATDDRERALAAAHAALAKRSRGATFTPLARPAGEGKAGGAIDLSHADGRKAAFAAIFDEETAAAREKLAAVRGAANLGPVTDALPVLATLEGLETAATGRADQTRATMDAAAEEVKKTVAAALRDVARRVADIDKQANTFQEFLRDTEDPRSPVVRTIKEKVYKRQGLTEPQMRELRELGATADRVPEALAVIGRGLRTESNTFTPATDEAARIRKDVNRLFDTDYERIYTEKPGTKKK